MSHFVFELDDDIAAADAAGLGVAAKQHFAGNTLEKLAGQEHLGAGQQVTLLRFTKSLGQHVGDFLHGFLVERRQAKQVVVLFLESFCTFGWCKSCWCPVGSCEAERTNFSVNFMLISDSS